jgi:hypothetical protein
MALPDVPLQAQNTASAATFSSLRLPSAFSAWALSWALSKVEIIINNNNALSVVADRAGGAKSIPRLTLMQQVGK